MKKNQKPIIIVVLVLILLGVGSVIILNSNGTDDKVVAPPSQQKDTITTDTESQPPSATPSLAFIIEEEKLAHDVYTTLQDKWGSRIFGNILQSESTHQALILPLLNARNITDPRSDNVGTFTDQSLQKLYDQLIAQGMQSESEAYKAGVVVEETDIRDLGKMLQSESDPEVITVLNKLKSGSESHLRAFQRQLNL